MKVAVMAAGGIGGYYGGLLAKSGHEVTFVARGSHLRAICDRGLHVQSIDDEFLIRPAKATDNPGEIGPVDLVVFSVKTYDTEQASSLIRPIVGKDTVIVTFQNGIESAERISGIIDMGSVVSAPTQIESFIAAPGMIEQRSNFRVVTFAELDLKSYRQIEVLAEVFRANRFQVNSVPDIKRALWLKFVRLAPVAGLSTLARLAPYDLFQSTEARDVLDVAMREIVAVGRGEGVSLSEKDLGDAIEWAVTLRPGIKPSMQKDIERGNRLEIDALSGAVVRLGKKHGLPTPANGTILVALKPEDDRNAARRGGGVVE